MTVSSVGCMFVSDFGGCSCRLLGLPFSRRYLLGTSVGTVCMCTVTHEGCATVYILRVVIGGEGGNQVISSECASKWLSFDGAHFGFDERCWLAHFPVCEDVYLCLHRDLREDHDLAHPDQPTWLD